MEWPAEFDDWTRFFGPLREAVLDEVSRRDLTIEACPSSNLAIAGFGDLTHHPIFRLDTYGLKNGSEREIRVTVNTDDPGIFATNLTNEYALLASAAEARGENPADVLRWIDHLRRRGLESTFLRTEGTEADQRHDGTRQRDRPPAGKGPRVEGLDHVREDQPGQEDDDRPASGVRIELIESGKSRFSVPFRATIVVGRPR